MLNPVMLNPVMLNPVMLNPVTPKLIALDIDGTLLSSQLTVLPKTKAALQAVAAKGHHVVVVSSRPPRSVRNIADSLEISSGVTVSFGGAYILEGDTVLFEQTLSPEIATEIIARVRNVALHVSLYSAENWFVEQDDYWAEQEAKIVGFTPTLVGDLLYHTEAVHKFLVMGKAQEIALFQEALRSSNLNVDAVRSKPVYCEVNSHDVHKASAVELVARHFGLTLADVIAFGDGENDLTMVREAGTGVAMGNAVPAVKAVAKLITKSNDEDGIAVALQELGLLSTT
jgi:Cof subfamily protein (haloacid dehalogenase superfamily)